MLDRLFRSTPKWQSPKSQKRIEALAELDLQDEKERQILLKLAREDSEPAVRREAMKFLTDLDILTQIQKRDLEAPVRDAATQRLQDLIAGRGGSPLTPEQRLAGIRRLTAPSMLVYIVREADHIDLKLAAIAQLSDEMFLDDIARHSSIARLRLAAAERVATPALLESLAEASKHKDKNVYKAIRARLDEGHQQEKETRALQERRTSLCEAMEHHARTTMNPLYAAKAESLRQQWQDVRGAEDTTLAERFETAFTLAWRQISAVAAAAQREADAAQAREEMLAAVATLEATLAEWQGQDDFDLPALDALRKTQQLRWEFAAELQAPPEALARRYAEVGTRLASLEQMLRQWQQDRTIVETTVTRLTPAAQAEEADKASTSVNETNPANATDTAEAELNRKALAEVLASYRDYDLPLPSTLAALAAVAAGKAGPASGTPDSAPAKDTARLALQAQLREKLDVLAASLKDGHSRDAARQLRKAQDFARDHHLPEGRLAELAAQLQELRSWAGFAVQPKKEELIQRMVALAGHDMDPDDKADAIHALQEEWKSLGVAEPTVEQPLWERFKAAGETAFAPCREHFAQQRELRERHLAQREGLCRQLQDYLATLPVDDTAIDWKKHEAILRTARQEWQRYHPSDRHKTRPVQERFQQLLGALEQRQQDVQERRAAQKRELIQRTRDLLAGSDLRAACDMAKRFQQEWKDIGAAQPKADRKLWQEFRTACDEIFGRREADFRSRQASREAGLQQARDLVTRCEQLAADPDPRAAAATAAELEQAFEALDLPRDQAGELRQRLQAARQQLQQAQRDLANSERQRQQEARLVAWQEKAQPADGGGDPAGQLLLDLEILLELPSPAGLEEARRTRQMQRLQQHGLRRQNGEETARLLTELLATPPLQGPQLAGTVARLREVLRKAGR